MNTFNDIPFKQHPCGEGFEGEIIFPNNRSLVVVCGIAVYNREGADVEAKANAADYTTFQYLVTDPDTEIYANELWVGPVSKAVLEAKISEVAALPVQGGAGE